MRRLVVALAAVLISGPAVAHRGHDALTVVEIDAATGAVTVTHRAAAHDVEPALQVIAPDAQQSLDDPDAVKVLEAYGGRRFRLWDARGQSVALAHVRTELAGDSVTLVYAGRMDPTATAVVTVDSNLFEEAHAGQENLVNVRRKGVTKSAGFVLGQEPQTLRFD